MKEEYSELVKFCDGLLIDDFNQTKQINDLKKEKLKLIQAVDILNKTIKDRDDELYRLRTELEETIAFRCVDCNKVIIVNSRDHDESKCDDNDNWYCPDCEIPEVEC